VDDLWKQEIPEEYRETTLVQEAKSLGDVVKGAIEAQALVGSSIRVPSEHASVEDVDAFTEKLVKRGFIPRDKASDYLKPKDPAHYELETVPVDAAEINLQQSDIDLMKARAHTLGLSKEQFKDFSSNLIDARRQELADKRARHAEANDALKILWGPDAFDNRRVQALMAIKRYGGVELAKKVDENPDPDILRAFAEIGKQFEEQGLGDLETPMYVPTREEATAALDEIAGNKDHPFNRGPHNAGKAAYEAAAVEVMRLKRISMGQPGQARDYMFR